MKAGFDSYCFHRYFGEVYPNLERDPGRRMTIGEVVDLAVGWKVDGIAIESFMVDTASPETMLDLKDRLDAAGLDRVWSWGHPRGLGSGTDAEALEDLYRHVEVAEALGARVMRICAGGRLTRPDDWAEHKAALVPMLRVAAAFAADHGVVLAVENHLDLLADQMVEVMETVAHPSLGVCLDTANNIRMFEDPLEVVRKLAPWTRATHLKDVTAWRGSPREFGFWPSVPLGRGLIDIPAVLAILRDAGYGGLLAVELDFLHPDHAPEEAALAESLATLRRLLGETKDIAA